MRAILVVLACFFLSRGLLALTWQDLLAKAPAHSNEIKSAQEQLDSSKWLYYKSFGSFLPQVSANASLGSSISTRSSAFGFSATQSLFKGFANYFNLQTALINYQSDDANLKDAKANYYYNLRLAYINLLSAQENIKVQEQILSSRRQNFRMIKLLYESGREDKGNYLKTQAQVADAQYSLSSAGRDLALASFRLSQLLDESVTSVEGEMAVSADQDIDLGSLARKAPAFLLAKYQLDLADVALQNTLSGFLPSVSLSASYQKSGSDWPPESTSKSISLNLSYPIFPGGTNLADRFIFSARLAKAREDFAASQRDLLFGIKEAYENLKDAIEANGVQRAFLSASAERAKIAQAKYLNGLIRYTEWDQIQNEYVASQRSVISSNKALLLAEADWYKTYGGYIR